MYQTSWRLAWRLAWRMAGCCWLLASSGCTTQYITEAVHSGSAEAGITDGFTVKRTGNFRFVPGTRVYVAVPVVPEGASLIVRDTAWRLARVVNAAFSGPFLATLAANPASRETARGAAAHAGASLLMYPTLVSDRGPTDLWHRDELTVQLEIFEVVTGRPVDRVLLHARAAFMNAEIDSDALQNAMLELAANLTGGSAPADHGTGNLL